MADESGGTFAGDGSVTWEVITADDDLQSGRKIVDRPSGGGNRGRTNAGVDKTVGASFRISFRVPTDPNQARAFLAQFAVQPSGGRIEVTLPIANAPKQIDIRWNDAAPGAATGPGRRSGEPA